MKLPLIVFIGLTIISIVSFIIFINIDFDLKLPDDPQLSGNLFDSYILNSSELSWLEKPEYAEKETQSINQESGCRIYECELKDMTEIESYVESIFNKFKENDYTVAYHVRDDESENISIKNIAISENISDYKTTLDLTTVYKFYYSSDNPEKLMVYYGGTKVRCRLIMFEINRQLSEAGRYHLCIKLYNQLQYTLNLLFNA